MCVFGFKRLWLQVGLLLGCQTVLGGSVPAGVSDLGISSPSSSFSLLPASQDDNPGSNLTTVTAENKSVNGQGEEEGPVNLHLTHQCKPVTMVGSWVSGSTSWSVLGLSTVRQKVWQLFTRNPVHIKSDGTASRGLSEDIAPQTFDEPPPPPQHHGGRAGPCYGQHDAVAPPDSLKAVTDDQWDLNSHQLREWEGISGPVSSDVLSRLSVTLHGCAVAWWGSFHTYWFWLLGWRPSLVLSTSP